MTLPELDELDALLADAPAGIDVSVVARVAMPAGNLPIPLIGLGTGDRARPAIGFFGGVHGLERIGTAVVLSYLRNVIQRLPWDESLHHVLERVRLVFMPIVNPGGMWLGTRANPRGVDLMRNAPIDARERVPFLIGGQRLGGTLPWYRGRASDPMEIESQALCAVAAEELLDRPFSLALDCHSGFGNTDRIWFPYAHTREPIEHLPEVWAVKRLLDAVHCHHRYLFEPQSINYLAHGDLWDHLYRRSLARPERVFVPLTLEMGSWLWVRKNPRQLFSRSGIFNPVAPHRYQRTLRRHGPLMDFLLRAAASCERWLPAAADRDAMRARSLARWYPGTPR